MSDELEAMRAAHEKIASGDGLAAQAAMTFPYGVGFQAGWQARASQARPPREPTDPMIVAGHNVRMNGRESFNYIRAVYKAMYAAAPASAPAPAAGSGAAPDADALVRELIEIGTRDYPTLAKDAADALTALRAECERLRTELAAAKKLQMPRAPAGFRWELSNCRPSAPELQTDEPTG